MGDTGRRMVTITPSITNTPKGHSHVTTFTAPGFDKPGIMWYNSIETTEVCLRFWAYPLI